MKSFIVTLCKAIALMAIIFTCLVYGSCQQSNMVHGICIAIISICAIMFQKMAKTQ